jgi:SAM-dependent methyltransferase
MPTLQWLKQEFDYGYDSGDVLAWIPNRVRRNEERRIGGSYRRVFRHAVLPYLKSDSTVLELGPGRGSWSRAILKYLPQGKLITVDFQDVDRWLRAEEHGGRLVCHQVQNNSFDVIHDASIDFFWSMGVLCHNNLEQIFEVMSNALPKMKPGGVACHQYSDWDKLTQFGWERGSVPREFQSQPDDQIWWPRNSSSRMASLCRECGWQVESPDIQLLRRDGLIRLRRPQL